MKVNPIPFQFDPGYIYISCIQLFINTYLMELNTQYMCIHVYLKAARLRRVNFFELIIK